MALEYSKVVPLKFLPPAVLCALCVKNLHLSHNLTQECWASPAGNPAVETIDLVNVLLGPY